jgi:CubicO group peptidase (beta-lactamase class C family)
MKRISQRLAIVVFVVVGTLAPVLYAQPLPEENPAEARIKEFSQAISTGSPEELKRFVGDCFGAEMSKIPMQAHMSVLMSYWDTSHGLEFYRLQRSGPYQAEALLKNKLTGGWNAIFVRVDPEAPHRIIALRPSVPVPPQASGRKLSDRQIAHELDAFMRRLAAADVFSGTVALARDGTPVFKGAYGQADRNFSAPSRIDTKFNIGSMNKMFTAVAVAQLVERGRLSYDDPLSKFLPDFPDPESANKIRIMHLLTHTAGLGGYFGKRYQQSAKASLRTVDDMISMVADDERLQFEPGTKFQYSNTGFLILGKVIEKVTGMSYYDYVRENLYKVAGMENSDSYELDKITANLAIGYEKSFDELGKTSFHNNLLVLSARGGPQGGGYSTVDDLVKFTRALQSGKLLQPESVRALLTAKPELNAPRYGYGFDVDDARGIAGHGGGFAGISANLDMFPRLGWTAVVLSNYTEASEEISRPIVAKMRELVEQSQASQQPVAAH